jgi:TolA-binding protein
MTRSIFPSLATLIVWLLPGVAAGQRAYTEDRISQLERSVAEIQSRIEQLRQQNQQLQQKLDKMQGSQESRLQRLERGSAKPPSPGANRAKP